MTVGIDYRRSTRQLGILYGKHIKNLNLRGKTLNWWELNFQVSPITTAVPPFTYFHKKFTPMVAFSSSIVPPFSRKRRNRCCNGGNLFFWIENWKKNIKTKKTWKSVISTVILGIQSQIHHKKKCPESKFQINQESGWALSMAILIVYSFFYSKTILKITSGNCDISVIFTIPLLMWQACLGIWRANSCNYRYFLENFLVEFIWAFCDPISRSTTLNFHKKSVAEPSEKSRNSRVAPWNIPFWIAITGTHF